MPNQSRVPLQILLTRPAAQSLRFAGTLHDRFGPDLKIVISPLLAERFLDPELVVAEWEALILTSETAAQSVRRISAHAIKLPKVAFCVGDHTAATAAGLGMLTLSSRGGADELFSLIVSHHPTGLLLHLRGEDSRGDLAHRLISAGIETVEQITYRQEAQHLNASATALLRGSRPIVCPIFSPRSATILLDECLRIASQAPLTIVALSPAVAAGWTISTGPIVIAQQPNAAAMVDAIAIHIESVGKP